MAMPAGLSGVLAPQRETGLAMVELLGRRLPLHDVEILAVVFGMTLDAGVRERILLDHAGVVSQSSVDPPANLNVT